LYRYWANMYDTISYQIVSQNGKSLIHYNFSADTILTLTNGTLIFKNPQGSDSKIFFTKY
jgi:hypothetical protein